MKALVFGVQPDDGWKAPAGANELTSVTFQTTRLKEVRADARRRAVAAAREKAELYCSAAGVSAGISCPPQDPASQLAARP